MPYRLLDSGGLPGFYSGLNNSSTDPHFLHNNSHSQSDSSNKCYLNNLSNSLQYSQSGNYYSNSNACILPHKSNKKSDLIGQNT